MQMAGTGDNAVQINARLFTGKSGHAAANLVNHFTKCPGNKFSRIEGCGFLPGEPFNWNGDMQTLDTLAGEKGILLVFNRSFDWCPFCKAQLDGLQQVTTEFDAAGFTIVTITYDPVDTLKLVEEDMGVSFTMLYDEAIKHVNAYNILNMAYEPGHFAYGVPNPGVMLVNPEGVILAKFAEENFRVRPDWADVVAAAQNL